MPYYIHKHLPSEDHDMLHGERIIFMEKKHPFTSKEFEGPYDSLKELKNNSTIYLELLKTNSKRAQKISTEKFIVKVENIIIFPDIKEEIFMNYIFKIMQHSMNGNIKSNDVSGIHLFSDKVRIIEVLKENKLLDLKKCIIEVYNDRTNNWVKKTEPTSFFPKSWDLQRLIIESYIAFKNKTQINEFTYRGNTSDNIELEFIIKNEELRTVYPVI